MSAHGDTGSHFPSDSRRWIMTHLQNVRSIRNSPARWTVRFLVARLLCAVYIIQSNLEASIQTPCSYHECRGWSGARLCWSKCRERGRDSLRWSKCHGRRRGGVVGGMDGRLRELSKGQSSPRAALSYRCSC